MKRTDSWLVKLRALLGTAVLAWELGVDMLKHWPVMLILVFWLLGGPIEELVKFFTSGRIQINVKKNEDDE